MRAEAVLLSACCALVFATTAPALAGPPYLTDDPEPTDYKHFEIYTFNSGIVTHHDTSGESGIDFNYGGAPNLQLTATLPVAFDAPSDGPLVGGPGNVELASKYRFLTQQNFGFEYLPIPTRVFFRAPRRMLVTGTPPFLNFHSGSKKTGTSGLRSEVAGANITAHGIRRISVS